MSTLPLNALRQLGWESERQILFHILLSVVISELFCMCEAGTEVLIAFAVTSYIVLLLFSFCLLIFALSISWFICVM